MAVQMHVAYSSIMRGVGVIAGVAYDCANSDLPSSTASATQGFFCMSGAIGADISAKNSIDRTKEAAIAGGIDDPTNLPRQKVWLFSGYNDGLVRRGAMDAVSKYYLHYADLAGNVFYKTNNHAPHALITDDPNGEPCLHFNDKFVNNCTYDAAGLLLQHIYGSLNSPSGTLSSPQAFDQREFQDPALVGQIGLADTGWVYVPNACETETCRVHVVFHGCRQYEQKVGDAVYSHGGYNKWADKNKTIVLYPQTQPIGTDGLGAQGCWDWWGLSDALPGNREFARKTGHQISAIKKMLDRLAGGPPHAAGPSDTFGTPQHFSVVDTTSTSVALVWQSNSAATGFNIYRSRSSAGTYKKINSGKVSGASFVDRGLTPNTTYYYKITAVDSSNNESSAAGPAHEKTASKPPACDPYFGDNVFLTKEFVAYTLDFLTTWAAVSNEYLGPYSPDSFSQLTKENGSYHLHYCP